MRTSHEVFQNNPLSRAWLCWSRRLAVLHPTLTLLIGLLFVFPNFSNPAGNAISFSPSLFVMEVIDLVAIV